MTSQDHATTVIQYSADLKAQAETVAQLFPGAAIHVVLGQSCAAGVSTSRFPGTVPSSVEDGLRSVDDAPCSNLTYGSAG